MKKQKSPIVFIEDILESTQKIQEYLQLITEQEFYNNTEKQDAVIRRLLIIGEAAKNVSESVKTKYPEIAWRDIIGMRNILVHQYAGVTLGLVYRVATKDLVKLEEDMMKIKKDLTSKNP